MRRYIDSEIHRFRQTKKKKVKQSNNQTDRQRDKEKKSQRNRQADRLTVSQSNRQKGKKRQLINASKKYSKMIHEGKNNIKRISKKMNRIIHTE